jgi:hypothetical protein
MLRFSAVGGKLPLIITVASRGKCGGKGWVSMFMGNGIALLIKETPRKGAF